MMELQGYGQVEARPTYAHVGYGSAAVGDFVRPVPAPAMLGVTSAVLLVAAAAVCAVAARPRAGVSFGRRAALVGLAGVLTLAGGQCWISARTRALVRRGVPTPEVLQTLQALERLTAESRDELAQRPPSDAWIEGWRAKGYRDGWGNPFVLQREAYDEHEWFVIRSAGHLSGYGDPYGRPGPDLTSDMLGPDGLFGTRDDESTMKYLAFSFRIDPDQSTGSALPRWRGR